MTRDPLLMVGTRHRVQEDCNGEEILRERDRKDLADGQIRPEIRDVSSSP